MTRDDTGTRWNQRPWMYDFMKPTCPPSARAATEPSALRKVPRVGSSTSSRVSREMAPLNPESRTCGKMRSIRA